jgi:hypothetical protein
MRYGGEIGLGLSMIVARLTIEPKVYVSYIQILVRFHITALLSVFLSGKAMPLRMRGFVT